ncbi:TIR domain-containing protein [Flammeovirga aprica]|uniref:Thoeris protein ThsB TIR-like domain-containing protein n=1 Tax=Flammeovirga aprica JL-4 TaxID=694437 RepID=A0A7X9RTP0_9BACT|nr:TIR domain-containing protein [Flammeovirga aprica]NME68760.1 hypothetical protein [Flammeovirga aprica JL-4]
MANKTGNYCAFYVTDVGTDSNLASHSVKDFVYYNLLRAWKGSDSTFPFVDSHNKNYNVRDSSDWETTLKPRLRDRINKSKNLILFLSKITKNSKAVSEEINHAIDVNEIPVIVIYPDYQKKSDIINCSSNTIKQSVENLWDNIPKFRDLKYKVPVIHIPLDKKLIRKALEDPDFRYATKTDEGDYFYEC